MQWGNQYSKLPFDTTQESEPSNELPHPSQRLKSACKSPLSNFRVFSVCSVDSQGSIAFSCGQLKLIRQCGCSDYLSLPWVHMSKETILTLWIIFSPLIRNAWKVPLCNLQTMQAQISLCICAGWSGPSMSACRINGYHSLCRWTENAQIRLHGCACSSGSLQFAYGRRAFFPC